MQSVNNFSHDEVSRFIEKNIMEQEISPLLASFVNKILKKEDITAEQLPCLDSAQKEKCLDKIRKKIQKVASCFSEDCETLSWCTGSRSHIFIGLEQVKKDNLEEGSMALVPTGRLINHNIVPLCGELSSGIATKGVNQLSLSGVMLSDYELAMEYALNDSYSKPNVEESKSFIRNFVEDKYKFKFSHTYKLHVLRYLKLREENDPDFEEIRTLITKYFDNATPLSPEWKAAYENGLIRQEENQFYTENFPEERPFCEENTPLYKGSIIGYRTRNDSSWTWNWAVVSSVNENNITFLMNANFEITREKTQLKRPEASDFLPEKKLFSLSENSAFVNTEQFLGLHAHSNIKDLYDNYDKILPLSPHEKNRLTTQNYPVIFGAAVNQERLSRSGFASERICKGSLRLGNEIKVLFVKNKNLQDVNQWIETHDAKIKAATFSSLIYLTILSFINHEGSIGLAAERMSTTPSLLQPSLDLSTMQEIRGVQNQINAALQNDILPVYGTMFSANPTYRSKGQEIAVQRPFYGANLNYSEYRKAVQNGKMLPRNSHGAMHATRTAIWSQLFINMMPGSEQMSPRERFLLAVAAASHDSKRKDEGEDHWDVDSSEFVDSYLMAAFPNPLDRTKWVHALANKDPAKNNFTCPIQRAIHDADCLEYFRVLSDKDRFEKERLTVFNMPGVDQDKLNRVIEEAYKFIAKTDGSYLKNKLERHSTHYYKTVLGMIKAEEFPEIYALLKEEIASL